MKGLYESSLNRYILFLLLFFRLQAFAGAQEETSRLQILNQNTGEAVAVVYYTYAGQKGASNAQGIINLHVQKGASLHLSHVGYGQMRISPAQLEQALTTGILDIKEHAHRLQPITVMATRPKISGKQVLSPGLQDRLSHDAGAFLNQISAISTVRKSGSYGFDPVLRGFKYEQLNIVIDGAQCANAACPNRMDPPASQIALNMVEQVDILKGPHALRYGNSLGGAINFVTPDPEFSAAQEPHGRASASYESNGDLLRSEAAIGMRGELYDLSLLGSWSQGNDYRDGAGVAIPSEYLRGSFGATLGLRLSDTRHLVASATRNLARDVEFPALPMDLRDDDTWLFNIRHIAIMNRGPWTSWNTTAFVTQVDHLMDNLQKSMTPRMANARTDANTRTHGGRTEATLNFDRSWLYTGADFRIETAEGQRTREFLMGPNKGKTAVDDVWQEGSVGRVGLFGEYHLDQNSYQLVFSGRLEINRANASTTREFAANYTDIRSSHINPGLSFGAIREFSPTTSAGLWFGRTQRSGGLTERYINALPVGLDPYEMLGNPNLDPEANNQVDLTLDWRPGSARIQADFFYSHL